MKWEPFKSSNSVLISNSMFFLCFVKLRFFKLIKGNDCTLQIDIYPGWQKLGIILEYEENLLIKNVNLECFILA